MEPFSFAKFFDFSMPTMGKVISLGIKLLLIAGITWCVYVAVIRPHTKPNPTTKEEAENIYHYTYSPKSTFGCTSVKVREYQEEIKEQK